MDINCLVCHQNLVDVETPEGPEPSDKDKDKSTTVKDLTSHFTKFFNFPFDTFFEHFDDSSACPSCSSIVRKIGAKLMKLAELEAEISRLKGQFEKQLISGYKSSLSQSGNSNSSPSEWDRHFHHRSQLVQGLGLVQNKMEEGDHDDQDEVTPHEFLQIDFEEPEEEEDDGDPLEDPLALGEFSNIYGDHAIKSTDKNVNISLKKLPTGQSSFKLSDLRNKYDLKIPTSSKDPINRQIKKQKKKKAIIEMEKDRNSDGNGDFIYCTTNGCDYKTRFQTLMNAHTHLHLPLPTHDDDENEFLRLRFRIFKCDVCFKEFPTRSRLDKHQKIHTDRSQPCHVCGRVLKNKVSLDVHLKTHIVPESSFICSKCGKSLVSKSGLKLHVMRCFDIVSFKCSKCPKKYVTNAELTKHVRIIHDGRTFNCIFCEKKYKGRTPLNVHIRSVHTGEKPFKCLYCGQGFASMSRKKLHEGTHTKNAENMKYQCKFCDKKFLWNKYLYYHLIMTNTPCKTKFLEEREKYKIALQTD